MCFPSAPAVAPSAPAPSTSSTAKAGIPGAKANAAARAGGGISPEFLSNLVGSETGVPAGSLDVLSEIRGSLNQGGG